VQVYRRDHCRRCGSPTRTEKVAGRTLYWCPVDQAEHQQASDSGRTP
jgi:formamidopyrimidine-DNA glycosylase